MAALPASGQEPKLYSVCEIMSNLKSLQGQTVAIRGTIRSGGHGAFLSGDCTSHLVNKGFVWPDIIWLEYPMNAEGEVKDPDPEARERTRPAIRRLKSSKHDKIVITLVGTITTRDLEKCVDGRPGGRVVAFGFGPDNDAPAQLAILTEKDPAVIRKHK